METEKSENFSHIMNLKFISFILSITSTRAWRIVSCCIAICPLNGQTRWTQELTLAPNGNSVTTSLKRC